jgi:hypothetical protein
LQKKVHSDEVTVVNKKGENSRKTEKKGKFLKEWTVFAAKRSGFKTLFDFLLLPYKS